MAVNLETLEKDSEKTTINSPEMATYNEIERNIRGKIEAMLKKINKPISISIFPELETDLFRLEEKYSHSDDNDKEPLEMEAKRMQKIGVAVMKKFGLDEKNSKTISSGNLLGDAELGIKITNYPSGIYKGLSFQRTIHYGSGINYNKIQSISWFVVGKTPFLKIDVKSLFKKQPPTQIFTATKT